MILQYSDGNGSMCYVQGWEVKYQVFEAPVLCANEFDAEEFENMVFRKTGFYNFIYAGDITGKVAAVKVTGAKGEGYGAPDASAKHYLIGNHCYLLNDEGKTLRRILE